MNKKIPGGFNPVEASLMRRCNTPEEAREELQLILEARRGRTKAANESRTRETREQRRRTGADRTGIRGTGGASKRKADDDLSHLSASEAVDEAFEDALSA
jgi:hypothetical protein